MFRPGPTQTGLERRLCFRLYKLLVFPCGGSFTLFNGLLVAINCRTIVWLSLSVTGLKGATDEGSVPEIAQFSPYYIPLNVLLLPKDQPFIFLLYP